MPDFTLPLPDKRGRKRFFLRWQFFALVFCLVAIAGAVIYFGPGRQYIRDWRAESHLDLAKSLAKSEEWEGVSSHASQSMKLAPSLDALRLVAKAAYKNRKPEVLTKAWNLFQFQGATLEDRTWALKLAFDFKDLKAASAMAEQLTPEEKKQAAIRYQLVRGLLVSKKFGQALAFANEESAPEDRSLDLLLAVSLAKSGLVNARVETNSRLRNVIWSEDRDLALRGLEVLSSLNDQWLDRSVAQQAITRFVDDADLNAFHSLQLTALKLRLGHLQLNETVDEAIARYRESDTEVLLRWLIKFRQYDRVIVLTADPEVQKTGDIFRLRLEALEQTKDWPALQAALVDPPVSFPVPLRLALESLALKAQDQDVESLVVWQKAFAAAQDDEEKNWFYYLVKIAGRMGYKDGQMESLISAISRKDGEPPAAKSLTPLFAWLIEKKDEERLLSLSEDLLLREPNNPALLNNFLYLKGLYQGPQPEDLEALQQLVEDFPAQQNYRRSLAVIQLLLNRSQDAIDTIQNVPMLAPESRNTELAIQARALFSLGNEAEARALKRKINYAEFSGRENEILRLPDPEEEEVGNEEANKNEDEEESD